MLAISGLTKLLGVWMSFMPRRLRSHFRNYYQNVSPSKRDVFAVLLVVGCMIFVLVWSISKPPPPPPTPQQLQAEAEARKDREVAEAQEHQRKTELCRAASICSSYAKARQECAVAGNYDQCMSIRFSGPSPIYECTNDGKLMYPPDDMPPPLGCWLTLNLDRVSGE